MYIINIMIVGLFVLFAAALCALAFKQRKLSMALIFVALLASVFVFWYQSAEKLNIRW